MHHERSNNKRLVRIERSMQVVRTNKEVKEQIGDKKLTQLEKNDFKFWLASCN
jgi:hypothetical protein